MVAMFIILLLISGLISLLKDSIVISDKFDLFIARCGLMRLFIDNTNQITIVKQLVINPASK
jgi:hypothetical protein